MRTIASASSIDEISRNRQRAPHHLQANLAGMSVSPRKQLGRLLPSATLYGYFPIEPFNEDIYFIVLRFVRYRRHDVLI